jgi:hypothetical protein
MPRPAHCFSGPPAAPQRRAPRQALAQAVTAITSKHGDALAALLISVDAEKGKVLAYAGEGAGPARCLVPRRGFHASLMLRMRASHAIVCMGLQGAWIRT